MEWHVIRSSLRMDSPTRFVNFNNTYNTHTWIKLSKINNARSSDMTDHFYTLVWKVTAEIKENAK